MKLNCVEKKFKIRGVDGVVDTDDVDEVNDDIIFVDDDRWQFCQHVVTHLGYFL